MYFQFCPVSFGRHSNENEEWRNSQGNRDSCDVFAYCICYAYPGLIKNEERAKQPKNRAILFLSEYSLGLATRYVGKADTI